MDMVDNRNTLPDLQWELLNSFAEEYGTLTWDSPSASRKNQKRKEKLAKVLRNYFQIKSDPFERIKDEKGWTGWKTRFLIEPSR